MSKKLPSVTSDIPRDLRTFIDRLREIISGNGYDRLVTAQDLINGGIAGPGGNGSLVPPTTGVVQTPPAPANVSATGGVYSVFVEWDNPTYYGHDYAEVYSGATDVIGDAVLLGFTPGVNYVDTIGPSQSRYYWVRFVNTLGVKGPFNSVSGTLGTTTAEVQHLLNVLTGAITETQLYQDLGARIDLIDGLSSVAGSVNARIQAEATARANAILDEASARNSAILAEATARGAAITNEATIRQNADSSLASQITTITASVSGNAAAIQQEATTRANADSAEAALRVALAARVTDAETGLTAAQAAITTESTTRANADSALSSQITTLTATTVANTAAIQSEATTRANADSAEATARQTLAARVTDAETGLTAAQAAITTESSTRATADTALSSQITALTSTVGANTAAITTESTTRANADSALSSQITALTSTVNSNTAAISTEATTRANADSALTSQITTLSSTVGSNTTAIQQEASTRATQTGDLFAKYTVKIDTNGYVSGFGLASTANNATPFSEFIIRADRFSIASPTGPGITPVVPFIVTTTPTTINGVSVPVGVYINGAYIQGGSIQGASIAGGTIENTKLINVSANKITGAALEATSYIESAAYIAGSQGWKIHANGTAEFAAASIRGQLLASQIDTRNLTIKDSSGNVLFGSGTNLDYSLVAGTKPPSDATRNRVYSQATQPTSGMAEGDLWNDTGSSPAAQWIYLSGAWRLTSTVGATFTSGVGQIAGQIDLGNISTYIAGAAIGTAYISNLAVTTAKIDNLAVTNAKIDNLAITTAKIDNLAVTSAKIGDAEVATLKIAGNAVTVPANGGGYSGVALNKSGFAVWQDFSEVYVDFGSISPTNVLILVTCNLLYSSGSGNTATFIRVIETVSGTTTLDNGITHNNSTLISIQAGMTGSFTGVRHFVVQLSQLTSGPSFYASNTTISVQGAKR